MKRILTSLVVLSLILLTGCAGTALRPEVAFKPAANQKFTYEIDNKAQMTDEGLTILRERLTSQLTASGIHTASSDGTAFPIIF